VVGQTARLPRLATPKNELARRLYIHLEVGTSPAYELSLEGQSSRMPVGGDGVNLKAIMQRTTQHKISLQYRFLRKPGTGSYIMCISIQFSF
jgi:hypothetical protein